MFAINQYNEGVHVPDITGVILGRGTKSDIVFYEQIGRALAINDKMGERIRKYQEMSLEEVMEVCEGKGIVVSDLMSKDDMIERIVAPLVIDLAGNFKYIRDLITDLRKEVRRRYDNGEECHLAITDKAFDVEVMGEEVFNLLCTINEELAPKSFEEVMVLASNYYSCYGNLNVARNFRTDDGVEYSQFGYSLGEWIVYMRRLNNRGELPKDKYERLDRLGMVWHKFKSYEEAFGLAKEYYLKYHNLNISSNYKTEDGYSLGLWIVSQRRKKKMGLLSMEMIEQLESIGMVWQVIQTFQDSYELLEKYYGYYGDIDLSKDFRTCDGINYDSDGFNLSNWLNSQRNSYDKGRLSVEKK